MASMSLPIVMSWQKLDSVAEAVWKSSVKIQASVSMSSSSTSQFAEDTYTPSSESAQNAKSTLAAESSGSGASSLTGIGKIQSGGALQNLKPESMTQSGESSTTFSSIELSGEVTSGIFVVGYEPNCSIYVMGDGSVSTFFQASLSTAESESSVQVDGNLQNSIISEDGAITRREDSAILSSSFSVSSSESNEDATF